MSFEFVSYFGFRASNLHFCLTLASFAPLRLAPWNILSTEALSFHSRHYFTGRVPWNTDSTKIELFARSAISRGKSSFIGFPKPKFNGKFQICWVRIYRRMSSAWKFICRGLASDFSKRCAGRFHPFNFKGLGRIFLQKLVDGLFSLQPFHLDLKAQVVGAVGIDKRLIEADFPFLV